MDCCDNSEERELTFREEARLYEEEAKAEFQKEEDSDDSKKNATLRRGMYVIEKAEREITARGERIKSLEFQIEKLTNCTESAESLKLETLEMTSGTDYEERFRTEYLQLMTRISRLGEMLERHEAGSLPFVPKSGSNSLWAQLSTMQQYALRLEIRADDEKIALPGEGIRSLWREKEGGK